MGLPTIGKIIKDNILIIKCSCSIGRILFSATARVIIRESLGKGKSWAAAKFLIRSGFWLSSCMINCGRCGFF